MHHNSVQHFIKKHWLGLGSSEAGFTLVETLIAVALLAVVSGLSLTLMMHYIQGNEQLNRTVSTIQQMTQFRSIVRDDLIHLTHRGARDFYHPSERFILYAPASGFLQRQDEERLVLQFTRTNSELGRVDLARSRVETIRYILKGQDFIRRVYARPDIARDTPYKDQIILSNIQTIQVKFRILGAWVDDVKILNASATVQQAVPELLQIIIDREEKAKKPEKQGNTALSHYFQLGRNMSALVAAS